MEGAKAVATTARRGAVVGYVTSAILQKYILCHD